MQDEVFAPVSIGCDLYPGHPRIHDAPLRLMNWVHLQARLQSVPGGTWVWGGEGAVIIIRCSLQADRETPEAWKLAPSLENVSKLHSIS